VPVTAYAIHEAMDKSLVGIIDFLRKCGKELAEFFGDVGTNKSMQRLLREAGLCFDWQRLARQMPRNSDVQAFLDFSKLLEPVSQKWSFPEDATFQDVPRQWSKDFTLSGTLSLQYLMLLSRVRAALMAAERKLPLRLASIVPKEIVDDAKHWSLPGHAVVLPLRVFVEMQYLLAQWWQPYIGKLGWRTYQMFC
jgi:hypothetical protein